MVDVIFAEAIDDVDVLNLVDDSFEVFCDGDAFGVLTVEISWLVENGGLPEALLTWGVVLIVIDDGVTKIVVDDGVGAAEKGFGTKESMTPIGPSSPMSASVHANSSG